MGDRAQWDPDIGFLEVLEGNYNFSMTVFDFDSEDDAKLDQAKALASKAIDRLR